MKILKTRTILPEKNKHNLGTANTNSVLTEDSISSTDYSKITNWDVAYASIDKNTNFKEYEKFWNAYYEKEWGTDAPKIKALGETFIIEIEELGFDAATNPFITFLTFWTKEASWPKNLNGQAYKAIHNAYVRKFLSNKDLARNGQEYTNANIIYCPALYDINVPDILLLIKKQDFINSYFERGMSSFLSQTSSSKIKYIYGKKDDTATLGNKSKAIVLNTSTKNTFLVNAFSSEYNPKNIEETICNKTFSGSDRSNVWSDISKINSPAIVENIIRLTLKSQDSSLGNEKTALGNKNANEITKYVHDFVNKFGEDQKAAFAKFLAIKLGIGPDSLNSDLVKILDNTDLLTDQSDAFQKSAFIQNTKINSSTGKTIIELLLRY